jgi:hypothetical protein
VQSSELTQPNHAMSTIIEIPITSGLTPPTPPSVAISVAAGAAAPTPPSEEIPLEPTEPEEPEGEPEGEPE